MSSGTFDDDQVHDWLADVAAAAWISLHYESPSLNGLGRGEISGGGYARKLVGFTVPTNRTIWSIQSARFAGLLANRLTHFGIWDQQNGGRLRAYGELHGYDNQKNVYPVLIRAGGGWTIPEGQLALSIA